ncbi:DUF4435 domain-containing protein [Vibrio harveyi]
MSSEPIYTAEEYLDSVLFSKNTKFIIAEGPFDQFLYTEAYEILSGLNIVDLSDHEIIFGGGKKSIYEWYKQEEPSNAKCIFDRDFDFSDYDLPEEFYVELDRYSIENYFFDQTVLYPFLRLTLSMNNDRVCEAFTLDDLLLHWTEVMNPLLCTLYYYQKVFVSDSKAGWEVEFLCQDRSYHLCEDKVNNMVNKLLDEMEVTLDECISEFEKTNINQNCISIIFPGKLLMESFFRYVKNTCKDIKPESSGFINNSKGLISQLVPRLIHNENFKDKLLQASA